MVNQRAELEWKAGVPIAKRFDDPYYSLDNGLAEARHVFLGGNDLPKRFESDFQIGELGFGTGLNALATWEAWDNANVSGKLTFTSFEAYPMATEDIIGALAAFPELAERARHLTDIWKPEGGCFRLSENAMLEVVIGDARKTVPQWNRQAHAWYLDGFSPAKNPSLWEANLLQAVAAHTAEGGTAATYSAAGQVRRNLEEAGFVVTRMPGYGRKRHMTTARRNA